MTGPKVGLLDIETAPLTSATWGIFDQNVGLNQIHEEWTLLSYCFKPLGGSKRSIEYQDNRDAAHPRDDAKLVHRLYEILDEYDVIIAHNGKRFDLKKIRARFLLLGYKPHSPVKVEDTLLMARQVAAFTSNKLEWLSTYLSTVPKSKHREFPGFELWAECLKGNPKAWAAMKKYNIPDVTSMEQVYLKLRPWVQGAVNVAVYDNDDDTVCCPVCGSSNIQQDGWTYTQTGRYKRYHCLDDSCGAWSRSRYTTNSKDKRKSLLVA
jgi:hemin uptake protein HemP